MEATSEQLEQMQKTLYGMAMHEFFSLTINDPQSGETKISVLRVPGGWVYMHGHGSVFVPFHNEYQPEDA